MDCTRWTWPDRQRISIQMQEKDFIWLCNETLYSTRNKIAVFWEIYLTISGTLIFYVYCICKYPCDAAIRYTYVTLKYVICYAAICNSKYETKPRSEAGVRRKCWLVIHPCRVHSREICDKETSNSGFIWLCEALYSNIYVANR